METREEKFKAILSDHKDKIYRLCCSYARQEEDRKDMFQNAMIKIWKNIASFKGDSSVSTWIFRITVNSCIDFKRKEKREKEILCNENISDLNLTDKNKNIEQNLITSEKLKILFKFLEKLSFIDKTLMSLYLEDLNYQEIAEIIGISEKNVSVKIYRIKKTLNKYFEEQD